MVYLTGFYVDRSATEPSVPFVLYIILGVDFLLPTIIFIVNEFSGRITENGSKSKGNLYVSCVYIISNYIGKMRALSPSF